MSDQISNETAQIAKLIAREFYFRELSDEQVIDIAGRFDLKHLAAGEPLLTQKEVVHKFYIVYKGNIQVEYTLRGGKKFVKVLGPGDYFGEEMLLTRNMPRADVTALEDSTLLVLEEVQFTTLLNEFPDIRTILLTTLESRRLARSSRFSWILPDEVVYLIVRKHWFFLIVSLIFPIILIVFSLPLIGIGIAGSAILSVAGFIMLGLGAFLFIWNWLDWGNDYYIVTDQRVVWIEKIVLLYDSRNEAPLTNILSVAVFTSFLGKILGYGDVSARTFTGQIPMRHTSKPFLLNDYIEGLRIRSRSLFDELEEKQMEDALAKALQKGLAPTPENILANMTRPRLTKNEPPEEKKKTGGLRAWWNTFLKIRYEQEGVITYRKALPILLFKIWLPSLLILVWIGVFTLLIGVGAFSGNTLCFGFGGMFVILAGLLFWLWYNYTDWHNDIYQLTPTQIFDIEKRPLGTEVKKTAELQNILTITHTRSFLGVILNYGDVVVTVGETQFIFYTVYNPDRVHQDIANAQEALRIQRRRAAEARDRERMINWLIAYNAESKKLEE